ncbi:MAG: hypothetical protein Q4G71_05840 [Pseudomonadota bacterium]|nr:hypothetical protein [Pseudomonadota bacterium]
MKKTLTLLATLTLAAGAQAACYTVLNAKGEVVSESPNPPVDMSYQLHQTVPYKFGQGATLVFGIADAACGEEVDTYYDLYPQRVSYQDNRRTRSRAGMRAPRRDRE